MKTKKAKVSGMYFKKRTKSGTKKNSSPGLKKVKNYLPQPKNSTIAGMKTI